MQYLAPVIINTRVPRSHDKSPIAAPRRVRILDGKNVGRKMEKQTYLVGCTVRKRKTLPPLPYYAEGLTAVFAGRANKEQKHNV